jgi:hypothetical protein
MSGPSRLDRLGMSPGGDSEGDTGVAEVMKSAGDAGAMLGRSEVLVREARCRDGLAGGVGEHEAVAAGLTDALEMLREDLGGDRGDGDRPHRRGVLGSLRYHVLFSSRMSCSVTLTLRVRRSTLERRSPMSSLHRIPESTARSISARYWSLWASANSTACSQVRNTISRFGTRGGSTLSHGFTAIFCLSTATCSIRRSVR